MEISQPYKGANAHLKTTYYELLNYGNSAVMVGMIVMWSGAVANIPTGWALCDGNNGTPDLRDRFIVAAGNSYNPGNNGNPDTHRHAVDPPQTSLSINSAGAHTHSFPSGWYKRDFSNGNKSGIDTNGNDIKQQSTRSAGSHAHSGTVNIAQFNSGSSSGLNRPKWYALCFIMKV
ncbi:MAG: tail fiber protein [Leptolyngbya sp. SIO1D8]|nr:tail fiber protein [Leptolyngbya sp. SIO1D8]